MSFDGRLRTIHAGRIHHPRLASHWITAFLLLVSSGCQAGINSPAGLVQSEPASATPEASLTPGPSITLALLGDVMLGRAVRPSSETFSYLEPYLATADLALANLESPLTDAPVQTESPYALCAAPDNVTYLADAGFDLLALSNNHSLDCGPKGLVETQSTLTAAGLGFIGPDHEPVYRVINGIRLAFLAFDATGIFNIQTAAQAVRSAREAGAVVIVAIHWGAEYQAGASTGQKQIAGELAEAGAALIWGHHPHVLQPAEWIHDDRTLVLYSLGNALFDQYGLAATRRSALVFVTLDSSGAQELEIVPFLIDFQNSRIVEADLEDAQVIMNYFK
jgi:poly-gamma-glutamate capsule biosynthesis protein CapA/YwtB (metallophosphatase superfamily)